MTMTVRPAAAADSSITRLHLLCPAMSVEEGPGGAFGPDPSRRQRARYPLSTELPGPFSRPNPLTAGLCTGSLDLRLVSGDWLSPPPPWRSINAMCQPIRPARPMLDCAKNLPPIRPMSTREEVWAYALTRWGTL